ncbi:hypothetical protein Hdeb2414_s0006g00217691 [Helianthus debilis subsp. tardiflorus]
MLGRLDYCCIAGLGWEEGNRPRISCGIGIITGSGRPIAGLFGCCKRSTTGSVIKELQIWLLAGPKMWTSTICFG